MNIACDWEYILKLDRNRSGSMTTKSRSDGNAIFVQYCRACDTHSWCTHHDQAKYHDTFLKFCDLCATYLPTFEVIGNMVPPHLIPFKIAENKYIDANTNKYVVYPQIGSFQVRFAGETVFSKKDSHTWPNLAAIVSKINSIADPTAPSPKIQKTTFQDKQTKKNSTNNSFLDSTDEHIAGTSIQPKGFTLTDHFKMYRPKNKFEDKDYLTEKQESELSCKQFSDAGPVQSREKTEKSEELIRVKDLFSETKLKEMLKTRGLMLKQQGKKEMIIKLDSIQEENAMIEDGLAATQRTQEKNIKKNNKMQQFQDQMSSLENKFINFENRVQDIQARGREFQYKNQPSDDKAKIKQLIESFKREQKPFPKREAEPKDKMQLMDKTNKLEQYLTYNQHQKNQKLHRIYGEWKLIKQFSSKNRRLLKKKQRPSQGQEDQQDSSEDGEYSQAHSQSPSANVLTFKPKVQRSLDRRPKNLVMGQDKQQPKYSTKEKYISKDYPVEVKVKTEDNFYKGKITGLRSKIQSQQMDMQPTTTTTKLVKKSINAMSMDALRSMANRQSNANNPNHNNKIQIDKNNFSKNVKVDIQKISNRINNIQQQLRRHKDWKQSSPTHYNPYDKEERLRKKSKNGSEKSSQFSSKEIFKYYGGYQQDSHDSINTSKHTLSNATSKQRFSNFSQLSQTRKNKVVQKHDSMIKQVTEPMESKQTSKHQNISEHTQKNEYAQQSKNKNKKQQSNQKLFRQRVIRIQDNISRQQKLALIRKTTGDNNSPQIAKDLLIKKTSANHSGSPQNAQVKTKKLQENKASHDKKIEIKTKKVPIDKNIPSNCNQKKEIQVINKFDNVSPSQKIKKQVKKERINFVNSKANPIQKQPKDHDPNEQKHMINQRENPVSKKIEKQSSSKLKIINNKQIVIRPKKIQEQIINPSQSTPQKLSSPQKISTPQKVSTPQKMSTPQKTSTPQRQKSCGSEAKRLKNQEQKPAEKSQFGKIKRNNKTNNDMIQQNPPGQDIQTQKQSTSKVVMKDKNPQSNRETKQQGKTIGTKSPKLQKNQTRQENNMRKALGYYKAEGMSFNGVKTNTQRNRNNSEKAEFNKQIIDNNLQLRPQTQKKQLNEEGKQLAQSKLFDNSQQYEPQEISRRQQKGLANDGENQGEEDDEQQEEQGEQQGEEEQQQQREGEQGEEGEAEQGDEQQGDAEQENEEEGQMNVQNQVSETNGNQQQNNEKSKQEESSQQQNQNNIDNQQHVQNEENQNHMQNQENQNEQERSDQVQNIQKQTQNSQEDNQNVSLEERVKADRDVKYQTIEGWKLNTDQDIEDNSQFQRNEEEKLEDSQKNFKKNSIDNQLQNNLQEQGNSQKLMQKKDQIIDKQNSESNIIYKTAQQTQNQHAHSAQIISKEQQQEEDIQQNRTEDISDEEMEKIVASEYGQFLQIKIGVQMSKQTTGEKISQMNLQGNENINLASQQFPQIDSEEGEAELTFAQYQPITSQDPEQEQAESALSSSQIEEDNEPVKQSQQQRQNSIETDPEGNVIDQYMLFIKEIVIQAVISQQFKQQYAPVQKKSEVFELNANHKILNQQTNNSTDKKCQQSNAPKAKKLKTKKDGQTTKNEQKSKLRKKKLKKNHQQTISPATQNAQKQNKGNKSKITALSSIETKTQPPNQILSANIQKPTTLVSAQNSLGKNLDHPQSPAIQKIASSQTQPFPIQSSTPIQSATKSPSSGKQNSLIKKKSVLSSFKLQDNVYSQPKDHKFKQIGVQKQLTNEVSIQTEVPSYTEQQAVLIARNNLSLPNQTEPLMINSQFNKIDNIEDLHNSEFQGTVRNNFLTEGKKIEVSGKKSKKQVLRARILDKIYSHNKAQQTIKFQNIINGCEQDIIKEEGAVVKLDEVYRGGILLSEKSLQVQLITTRFTKLLKNIEIISQKGDWLLTRLFQNAKGTLKDRPMGVWLCKNYQWQCFILDDNIKVDTEGNPLYTVHKGNQMWVNVLEKAVAYALGGYEELQKADSAKLFTLLTGCNAINVRVKEDPLKNIKILQLITECQRKNYIVHAQKNWDKIKQEKGRQSIYYILSIRRANAEEENLIELSQDTKQSFWVRLSKFVQEFSKIQILQLRINHNFAHIDLGVGNQGQISVVQLDFFEEGQGCVTLSYLGQSGPLKAFLYREEKSRVLKLVGQAKQKQKSSLFFQCSFSQGRYYIFAQAEDRPARLSYLGEGQPTLKITEQIHSDGLKNQVAEYLPVHDNEQLRGQRSGDMGQTLNSFKASKPRLRDNFMESRLRQNFVEYVMGRSRQIPESRIQ